MSELENETAGPEERLLEVRAHFELVKRKASLLEQRLSAWEDKLAGVATEIGALGQPDDGLSERLAEVERRLDRLERHKRAAKATQQAAPVPVVPKISRPERVTLALFRARWSADKAAVGETVRLSVQCDGIDEGAQIVFDLYSVADKTAFAQITGRCSADTISADWTIPEGIDRSAVRFTVKHGGLEVESPALYLPVP